MTTMEEREESSFYFRVLLGLLDVSLFLFLDFPHHTHSRSRNVLEARKRGREKQNHLEIKQLNGELT